MSLQIGGPLSKMLVRVFSAEGCFRVSRDKSESNGPAGKRLSYTSTCKGVLQWL